LITFEQAKSSLDKWRKKLLIPPHWQVDLLVLPPEEMENTLGRCSWGYLPNAEFRIRMRSDMTLEELEWTMAHELMEALLSPYAAFVEDHVFEQTANKGALKLLVRQHAGIRDAFIEHMLATIIGHKRPMRIY
jgi:hypothetical protein